MPNEVKSNDGEKLLLVTSECNNLKQKGDSPTALMHYGIRQASLFKCKLQNSRGQIPKAAEICIVKNTVMKII